MIYLLDDGTAFTRLPAALQGRQPIDVYYAVLTNREYKKARKLDKEKPSDPRSLSSILTKLNERRS